MLLRALWWRRGFSLALLIVATITSAVAALGPLYARAAAESVLTDRLAHAPRGDAGLAFEAPLTILYDTSLNEVAAETPAPGTLPGFPTRITGASVRRSADGIAGQTSVTTQLVERDGVCAHLVLVQGRCPARGAEIAISARAADQDAHDQWRVGGRILFDDPTFSGQGGSLPVQAPKGVVVGVYRPRDVGEQYWFRHTYFDAHPSSGEGADVVDAVFTTDDGMQRLASGADGLAQVDFPPDIAHIHLADLAAVAAAVKRVEATYGGAASTSDTGTAVTVRTGFDGILAAERAEKRLLDTGTLLVTLQLTLLALLVLFQVMSEAAEARGNEIALAKLRGLGSTATLRFGLAEPLALLLVALPLGLAAAYGAARFLASSALVPGTPVAVRPPVLVALGAALAGGAVATSIAAARTLTRPVLEQWRRTPGTGGARRVSLVVDLILAAAAVGGLVALQTRHDAGHPGVRSLAAPALLVFAVALLGVRLIPRIGRTLARPTRAGRRIGLFLAVRQLARRPGPLRLAALLAVAVGLAAFAIAGESVARANRSARAEAELGAPQVLSVQLARGSDPLAATRSADPDGAWAMAAAEWLPSGGGSVVGTVLGVDASRLAAVSYAVRGGLEPARLAASLRGATQPTVTLHGTRLGVTVDLRAHSGIGLPSMRVVLHAPDNSPRDVALGALRPGAHDYSAPLPCPTGCTLAGLTWDSALDVTSRVTGSVVVRQITVDGRPVDVGLRRASAWRGGSQNRYATDHVSVSADGTRDDFVNSEGLSAMLRYSDTPAVLPVVSTPQAIQYLHGSMVDTLDTKLDYFAGQLVAMLPRVQDNGVLADVSYLRTSLYGFDTEASWQVWLGPKAPPDAIARLTRSGLVLQSGATVSARVAYLGREGPALALLLLLATAVAGAVLAVGGTAVAITASGRRRSFELAALRVVGVRRGALLRSSIAEQLILLGAGVVLGVPTGWVAAGLTLPSIAEFADSTPVPLHYVPSAAAILAFAGAFALLLTATSVLAGRSLVALAVPSRLREVE